MGTTRSQEDSEALMTKHHPLRGPALSRVVAAVVGGNRVEPGEEAVDSTDLDTTAGKVPVEDEGRADDGNAREEENEVSST
jgi:hypothetical protein